MVREERPTVAMVEGEYDIDFAFTLYDDDGTVTLDGGATVEMRVQRTGEDAFVCGSGSISDAANGIVEVNVGTSDVANLTGGLYMAQVTVTSSTQRLRSETFYLEVEEAI